MYVLTYEYVEDIVERRAPHRERHLERIKANSQIVMAGAIGDPPHGALIVCDTADPAEVEAFAADDPYVVAGLVTARRVEPYRVV
jgi:uncharacterized protein YciI